MKIAKFIFWVFALSPLAPFFFYATLDFLIILASAKYNFLYYLIHYGLIILALKGIYKISQIRNRGEFYKLFGEIYKNIKENKWKFSFTFLISAFAPPSINKFISFSFRALMTGGMVRTSGTEIGEKAYNELFRGGIITTFRGILTYRVLLSNKDIQKCIDPQIRDHRAKIIGANMHHDRKKNPFFFSRLWSGGIIPSQMDTDFLGLPGKKLLTKKFRRNEVKAFLSQIEDSNLKLWLESFLMGDKDQWKNPNFDEGMCAIYFGEEEYAGQFYPNSLYRPGERGMGDFELHSPKGKVYYDIKNNHLFFSPNSQISHAEIDTIMSELVKKDCSLLIDGSHQSIESVQSLRTELSKHPNYKDIVIVHPRESLFERGLDHYLNTPSNLEYVEIMEDKAKFLTDSAINSGENLPNLVSDYLDENGNRNNISKEGFSRAHAIANEKLGSLKGEDEKFPWHIDEMGE